MGMFSELYRARQMRRFRHALRSRDADALSGMAREGGLRLSPADALVAANLLVEAERTTAAVSLIQQALLETPGDGSLLSALLRLGEAATCAADVRNAAAAGLADEADAARDSGRKAEAAALYGKALAIAPGAAHWRVQRANMLKDIGEIGAAELEYRRAQIDLPHDADVPLQLGRALKLAGRTEAALESFREALRRDPQNRAARDELAWLGDVRGQIGQSVSALERGDAFALFAIADAMAGLRESFARIEAHLPAATAASSFPPDLHDLFRRSVATPSAPPPPERLRLAVLFDADAGTARVFQARLDAFAVLAGSDVLPVAVTADAGRREEVLRRAAPEAGRTLLHLHEPGLRDLSTLLDAQGCDGLLLFDGETMPDPAAPGWFVHALARAPAAYADSESGRLTPGGAIERHSPVLRSAHDRHGRAADMFGRAFGLRRDLLATLAAAQPGSRPTAAALGIAAAAQVSALHIPLFLACDLGEAPSAGGDRPPTASFVATRIGCVIPTRDHAEDAERFVRSLRETARHPQALAIVVVDNGASGEALAALERLARDGVTVLRDERPFNWSRLNNHAAAQLGEADILLFANDDMEMLTPHWDDELRAVLARDGVGALGARLLYPDRTIQHAGMLCSWAGRPEHEGRGEPEDAAGPAGRWQRRRGALAVTGAFLATKRADYDALAGFDTDFPFGLNDVDFCLRLRERGRDTVYTPHITLIHHESKTRGRIAADTEQEARAAADDARFAARWPSHRTLDPTVNPNWCESLAPFRAYRGPTSAAVLRYLDGQGTTNPRG